MQHDSPVTDRRANPWVLLGVAGGVLLFHLLARSRSESAAQEVGLGLNTISFEANWGGRRISGPLLDIPTVRETFGAYADEGRPVALWLGASQLYAINNPEPDDELAVCHAQRAADDRGSELAYVMTASPNANLHELLAAYLAYRQAGLLPAALILGFTYDDLKEPGIRDAALDALRFPLAPETLRLCGAAGEHLQAAVQERDHAQATTAPIERTATEGTPQDWLEERLVAGLERAWPEYGRRASLRSAAIIAWKVPVTALAFKVLSRPQQSVPADMEAWNGAALDALFALTAADGVRLFVYKAPHRPDEPQFFHPRAAYDAYQDRLAQRCAREGAAWIDLETITPAEYWGTTNDGSPDVFHYRVEGHRRLGLAIDAWLTEQGF